MVLAGGASCPNGGIAAFEWADMPVTIYPGFSVVIHFDLICVGRTYLIVKESKVV